MLAFENCPPPDHKFHCTAETIGQCTYVHICEGRKPMPCTVKLTATAVGYHYCSRGIGQMSRLKGMVIKVVATVAGKYLELKKTKQEVGATPYRTLSHRSLKYFMTPFY